MSKPFDSLAFHSEQRPYVKGLYYAFGATDFGAVADPIEFANAYANHCAKDGSHISVQDCFKMFLSGEKVFKRV